MRSLAVVACCLLCMGTAAADTVDTGVRQLARDNSYKVRLAAALSLSKSKEPRAVIALAGALRNDEEATIRRVSVLALEKMIDARTADDARELGLAALENAAATDGDPKVRENAGRTLKALAGLRKKRATANAPPVFVNIDTTTDPTNKLPTGTSQRLTRIVKSSIDRTGYATTWPGGAMPTSADLSSSRSRGFIIASTVKTVDITKAGGQMEIACTVVLRVAPWNGSDGGERWEANKAASASGSAKATTGTRDKDIQSGVRQCVEAVAEDVTARQVVPFLKRLAQTGT
jgi:HEAT repeats